MVIVPSALKTISSVKIVPLTAAVTFGVSISTRLCESVSFVMRLKVLPVDCSARMTLL